MSPAGRNGITLKLHILLGSPCPQQWHCYKPQEKENRRGLYWSPSSLDASFHSWENWSLKSKKWPTQGHTDISRTRPGPARSPDSEGFFLVCFQIISHCFPRGAELQENRVYMKLYTPASQDSNAAKGAIWFRGQMSKGSRLLCTIPSGLQESPYSACFGTATSTTMLRLVCIVWGCLVLQ